MSNRVIFGNTMFQKETAKNMTHKKMLAKLLSDLEEYERIIENIDTELEAESIESALFQNKSNNTFPDLDEVKRLKGEVKEKLRIRICRKDENPFRPFILSGLLVVVALASEAELRWEHSDADHNQHGR